METGFTIVSLILVRRGAFKSVIAVCTVRKPHRRGHRGSGPVRFYSLESKWENVNGLLILFIAILLPFNASSLTPSGDNLVDVWIGAGN